MYVDETNVVFEKKAMASNPQEPNQLKWHVTDIDVKFDKKGIT